MSSNKMALKAAKAALDSHKYDDAAKEANKVLESEPRHYHAYVKSPTCGRAILSS